MEQVLLATLHHENGIRNGAEAQLKAMAEAPGFGVELVKIAISSAAEARISARSLPSTFGGSSRTAGQLGLRRGKRT